MEKLNDKIWQYVENNKLQMEKIIELYTNYICKIIRNSYFNISDEDMEEITLDVFLTLWKNQYKLDLNKNLSSYIAGIT
ncbi:MAG: sigma-70 family RNA polymerase sigma factor, partial [Clostridia bacterium]|nr:sigma-70 family RNA polymerase sigma factor [Clostridia bacterium]